MKVKTNIKADMLLILTISNLLHYFTVHVIWNKKKKTKKKSCVTKATESWTKRIPSKAPGFAAFDADLQHPLTAGIQYPHWCCSVWMSLYCIKAVLTFTSALPPPLPPSGIRMSCRKCVAPINCCVSPCGGWGSECS